MNTYRRLTYRMHPVDTQGQGITQISPQGPVFDGKEYGLAC